MTLTQLLIRIISALCIMVALYLDVWWLAGFITIWHVYQYRAFELIVIGLCIDIQFMAGIGIPWYTIGGMSIVLGAELLRPMLRNNTSVQL